MRRLTSAATRLLLLRLPLVSSTLASVSGSSSKGDGASLLEISDRRRQTESRGHASLSSRVRGVVAVLLLLLVLVADQLLDRET